METNIKESDQQNCILGQLQHLQLHTDIAKPEERKQ